MSDPASVPPARRPDLILRPLGDDGAHVVKDPRSGRYFNLGPQEAFLLGCLDGARTVGAICAAFAARFGEPLTPEDVDEFLGLARSRGFLLPTGVAPSPAVTPAPAPVPAAPAPAPA